MQSLPYVYIQSERLLYTVGHYSPAGWLPESDHDTVEAAAARVNYLNGGPAPKPERPTGPTLEYVRELESEAVAVKAERDRFVALCKTIQLWAEDENEERPVMPFWYLPLCEALFNSALAAAKEAQS